MKASEHFDLPLEANQESIYQQDGVNEHLYEFSVAEFNTPEQAKVAVNCINHADALAHALAVMLVEHSKHQLPSEASIQAAQALEAYRSAK